MGDIDSQLMLTLDAALNKRLDATEKALNTRLDLTEAALRRQLDGQDKVLGEIRAEAKLTNSRVSKLELWKARADGVHAAFHWMPALLAGGLGSALGALVVYLVH